MPLKSGLITPKERAYIDGVVSHGDIHEAARQAGYRDVPSAVCRLQRSPEVQREIVARQQDRLVSEALPLAIDTLIAVLRSPSTPAGARVQAVKLTLDKAGIGQPDAVEGKDPCEMSGRELDQAISKLRAEIEARSRKTIDVTPAAQPQVGVFD